MLFRSRFTHSIQVPNYAGKEGTLSILENVFLSEMFGYQEWRRIIFIHEVEGECPVHFFLDASCNDAHYTRETGEGPDWNIYNVDDRQGMDPLPQTLDDSGEVMTLPPIRKVVVHSYTWAPF